MRSDCLLAFKLFRAQLLTTLITVLKTCTNESARAGASVFTRSLLDRELGNWAKCNKDEQESGAIFAANFRIMHLMFSPPAVKSGLLEALASESKQHIRDKLAHAIGEAAVACYSAEQTWPQLLPQMTNWAQHADSGVRTTAMALFDKVAIYVGRVLFVGHDAELCTLLCARLGDEAWHVRLETIKAVASCIIAATSAEQKQAYSACMLPMLQALSSVLQADEFRAQEALRSMVDIAATNAAMYKPMLDMIVAGMLTVCKTADMEASTRALALELLTQMCASAPGMMRKHGRGVTDILSTALAFLRELEDDSDGTVWLAQPLDSMEQTYDSELQEELQTQGESTIVRVCSRIGGATVAKAIIEAVMQLLASQQWSDRRAGLLALHMATDGCKAQLGGSLADLTGVVLRHVRDQHPRVVHVALRCLGGFADTWDERRPKKKNFQDVAALSVVPVLTDAMLSTSTLGGLEKLRCLAADTMTCVLHFHHCKREHLEHPLDVLKACLDLIKTSNGVLGKVGALQVISCVAEILKGEFSAVYDEVVPILRSLASDATAAGERFISVRNTTIDTLSHICHAVGYERSQTDAAEILQLSTQSFASKASAVSDNTGTYRALAVACSRLAAVLGPAFGPYLPALLPPLLATATTHIEVHLLDANKDDMDAEELAHLTKIELTDHEAGSNNKHFIATDEHAVQDRSTAVTTLFQFVDTMPSEVLLPHLDAIADALIQNIRNEQIESTRVASLCSVHRLMRHALADTQAPEHAQRMLGALLPALNEAVTQERDRAVLQTALESYTAILRDMEEDTKLHGRPRFSLSAAQLEATMTAMRDCALDGLRQRNNLVLRGQSEDADGEVQEEVEEAFDVENEILTSVVDSVGYLIKVYKSEVLPVLESSTMLTLQTNLLDNKEPLHVNVRCGALCFLVDVAEHCGASARVLATTLLPHLLELAPHASPLMRQVAVYGLGIVIKLHLEALSNAADMAAVVRALVTAAFDAPDRLQEDMVCATTNAVSALIYLIDNAAGHPGVKSAGVDGAQVLKAIVDFLPATGDQIEARLVHGWFFRQVANATPGIVASDGSNIGALLSKVADIVQAHFQEFFSLLAVAVESEELYAQLDDGFLLEDEHLQVAIPQLLPALQGKFGDGAVKQALSSLTPAQQSAVANPASVAELVRPHMISGNMQEMAQAIVDNSLKFSSSLAGSGRLTLIASGLASQAAAAAAAGSGGVASPGAAR